MPNRFRVCVMQALVVIHISRLGWDVVDARMTRLPRESEARLRTVFVSTEAIWTATLVCAYISLLKKKH